MVLGAVFLLSLSPLTAPFRGERAFYRAQEALVAGDLETAGGAMVEAIELQPRNGTFATMMSYIHTVGGRPAPALAELERAARLQPGQPVVAADAANAAIRAGRLDRVEYWFEQTLAREPNGAKVFTESALFFSQIGQPDRARELLESFEELGSGEIDAWRTAEHAYLELGDELRAEQAGISGAKLSSS